MTQPVPAPGAPAEPAATPGAPAQPAQPTAVTPPAGPDPNQPVDVDSLPPNVKQLITNLRGEVAKERTQAKAKAAEAARSELLQQIGQALGLQDTPQDPAALADQLAATRLAEASARLELDVYRTAHGMGVDAARLLDSRRFAEAVDALPEEGFDEALKTLINQWVEADPLLRAGGQPAASSGRPVENLRSGALPAGESTVFDPDAWIRQQAGR